MVQECQPVHVYKLCLHIERVCVHGVHKYASIVFSQMSAAQDVRQEAAESCALSPFECEACFLTGRREPPLPPHTQKNTSLVFRCWILSLVSVYQCLGSEQTAVCGRVLMCVRGSGVALGIDWQQQSVGHRVKSVCVCVCEGGGATQNRKHQRLVENKLVKHGQTWVAQHSLATCDYFTLWFHRQ